MALSDGKEVSAIRGRSHGSLLPPPGRAEVGSVERRGVFYGTATREARALKGQDVYVVGGANSAG